MRLLHPVLASALVFGSLLTIGCSEHRYSGPGYGPYYGNAGYYGWNSAEDPYYRQWLAERQYNYIEYNRLDRERQREYWEWRNANAARFRNDPRFRNNQGVVRNDAVRNDAVRNDHDRDDRWNRDRQVARERDGDRDRHRADQQRHQVRNNNKNRDKDRDHDRDHDRDRR